MRKMRASPVRPFLLIRLACYFSVAKSICYYPDGSITPSDVACDDAAENSACCGLGYACLSNGICMSNEDTHDINSANTYVRGSCTDKTWRSSSCPNFCVNSNDPFRDNTAGGEGMAKCPDTDEDMYYCVDFNESAVNCTSQQNVITFPGTPSILTTIGVASSTSTTSSSTSSSATSSQSLGSSTGTTTPGSATTSASLPLATDHARPNHSAAIGAGVGVGVGVGLIVLGLGAFFLYRRRHNRDTATTAIPPALMEYRDYVDPKAGEYHASPEQLHRGQLVPMNQLHATNSNSPGELDGGASPALARYELGEPH